MADGGDGGGAEAKDAVLDFATYEDYLDAQISEQDLFYLEDEDLARQLVELGYHAAEFEDRKAAERDRHLAKDKAPKALASAGKDLSGQPFLQALASREELVRNGKLSSIIFIRDLNAKGQEVSGYIDFAHRLKTEAFEPYFDGKKRLAPRASDLSYLNWETQVSTSNSSPNFQVIADNETGLLFKNKRDRKVIDVGNRNPGDNSTRTEIVTTEYMQVVIFDHMTRRKS